MTEHVYGEALTDFRIGDRVALHPGTHAFLSGHLYGTVVKIGRKYLTIDLEGDAEVRVAPSRARLINSRPDWASEAGTMDLIATVSGTVNGPSCQYFARCTRTAEGVVEHPAIGYVPSCTRCADRMGTELIPAEFTPAN